ncbi:MAG: BON domain-containing protein [Rhodospirillales bacterium]|nr:BON domain-containing protein [Rhodospirillales bacterium]
MDDQALRQMVSEELTWAPHVDATNITVDVRDGVVRLGGVVGSLAEKHAAERTIWHVRGVRGLVEEIEVRVPEALRHGDTEIAQRVRNVLRWDAQIPDARLRIKVEDGVVTLMGTLDRQYQRQEAEARVRALEGVRGVANDIAIRPAAIAPDIAANVRRALARHAELDAGRITVAEDGASVALAGTVPSLAARHAAENAAWSAAGVAAVENRLSVAS